MQMKHIQDPEDPHRATNDACLDPDSGHVESNLSNPPHTSQNNNSNSSHRHSPTRKNKSSSNRIALKGIFRSASQQNGSAGSATILASAEGSAEVLIHHEVVAVGKRTSGATNSLPPDNAAARLNHITTLHQEAGIQFNRNRSEINYFIPTHTYIVCLGKALMIAIDHNDG